MTRRILILDNLNEQTAPGFEKAVRPLLKSPVEVDVVAAVTEAFERLAASDYALAVVESMLQKRPLDPANPGAIDLCSAADVVPLLLKRRPNLKVVVVAHSRSGIDPEEKQRLAGMPEVLGVFGWLTTAKNAKAVAERVDRATASSAPA